MMVDKLTVVLLLVICSTASVIGELAQPCKSNDDCTHPTNLCPYIVLGFEKYVGCSNGACMCFDYQGLGTPPMVDGLDCPHSKEHSECAKVCSSSDYAIGSAYTCPGDQRCWCKGTPRNGTRCHEEGVGLQDCTIRGVACTEFARCDALGLCICDEYQKIMSAPRKSYCKADAYCSGLCTSTAENYKFGFSCSIKTGKTCFCSNHDTV